MITFTDIKQKWTPEIIKKAVELAEGFEWVEIGNWTGYRFEGHKPTDDDPNVYFPLLLHRAVEGWLKIHKNEMFKTSEELIFHFDSNAVIFTYEFKNYLPCHLTACEMALMDCLAEVLR